MKTIIKAAGAIMLMFAVTACNTIEGAGKHVEAVGEATQKTGKDVKDEIND